MNLLQFFLILKARYKIIAVTFLITVLTAAVVVSTLPKSYKATASLLLNFKGMDPVTGMVLPAQLMPGYMATQVDIIHSRNIALKVVDQLGLANSVQAQAQFQKATGGKGDIHDWLANALLSKLEAQPSKESSVIEISFNAVEPNFAATIANAFADKYQSTSIQLKVEPAQKAAGYFGKQIQALRENLEKSQSRLSQYLQEKGMTNPEQTFDLENLRLNEMSSQLSIAQSATIDAKSRKSSANKYALDSPDVAASPIVQSLKIDLARGESKLAELSQRLSKNHPQYQSAQAELAKIRSQLSEEIHRASTNISGTANISQQREADLRMQVEIQKKRVLELNRMRDEAAVLQKDVEAAQRAMDAVTQRFSQTSIEGQSDQGDIAVLNPAIAPLGPSSPKVFLIILLSVFLGAVLGVALALLAEFADRRIRGREDISVLLEVPVFAVISHSKKQPIDLLPNKVQKFLTSS